MRAWRSLRGSWISSATQLCGHVVGPPDGLRIGYEGWTRFRVLVPGGQAAARVDLGYEYHLPGGSERPLTLHRPPLLQLAATEEYFATIRDACRP